MRFPENKGGREGAIFSWENTNFYSVYRAGQRTKKMGGKRGVTALAEKMAMGFLGKKEAFVKGEGEGDEFFHGPPKLFITLAI